MSQSHIIRPADLDTSFQHHHHQPHRHRSHSGSSSPVAPAYSPITPKVQPALPVNHSPPPAPPPPAAAAQSPPAAAFVPPENGGHFTFSVPMANSNRQQQQLPQQPPQPQPQTQIQRDKDTPMTPSAQYIPQPPNLPFSSEDASDAIALRAAISTLQFQKKKAQEDLKMLVGIMQLALDDPNHFKEELAAGRLSEQRPQMGDLRAILDASDDEDDEDDEDDDDDNDEVVLGAAEEDSRKDSVKDSESQSPALPTEIPDSQPSQPLSHTRAPEKMDIDSAKPKPFPRIPGPQNVVRMPPVNWDKYGIVGAPLESIHAQQQRWPGSMGGYGMDRGREHSIAAPYSPFLDTLDGTPQRFDDGLRHDFAATPNGTVSEHPMETRSRN